MSGSAAVSPKASQKLASKMKTDEQYYFYLAQNIFFHFNFFIIFVHSVILPVLHDRMSERS
jgi:hypothetical protein